MSNTTSTHNDLAIEASHRSGLAECIEKSFNAVHLNTTLSFNIKQQIIYSLLTLRCVFDSELIDNPLPLFVEYNLVKGEKMPEKMELFDLVTSIISLDNCTQELLALWYIVTAFILILEAPIDLSVFNSIKKTLHTEKVFDTVLYMTYSIEIPCSIEELEAQDGIPKTLQDWYAPYIDYILEENDLGQTKAEQRFIKWLSEGRFNLVLVGSDRMLNSYPFDEGILVCNLASRSSLEGLVKVEERIKFLTDCISIVNDSLNWARKKRHFLYYYKGLFSLGIGEKESAKSCFIASLEFNKNFTLAKQMLEKL